MNGNGNHKAKLEPAADSEEANFNPVQQDVLANQFGGQVVS